MFTAKDIANIILHIILISTFIAIFFFTYAANVEEQIVKDQVNYIVADFTRSLVMLPEYERQLLSEYINSVEAPDMSKEDDIVQKKNDILIKKVVKLIVATLLFGFGIVYGMSVYYDFSLKDLLIHNAIILLFVGLTEYSFLTFLAIYYRSGDSNYVKKTILESLASV